MRRIDVAAAMSALFLFAAGVNAGGQYVQSDGRSEVDHSSRIAAETTCPTTVTIPNYRRVTLTNDVSMVVAWDAPPGAQPGDQYDVLVDIEPNGCLGSTAPVTYTTSVLTYTVPLNSPNSVYNVTVQAHGNPCVRSGYGFYTDTFSVPPSKPALPTATVNNGSVTVFLPASYADPNAVTFWIERSGPSGFTNPIGGGAFICSKWSRSLTDYGPDFGGSYNAPALPPGTYQYRVRIDNTVGSSYSDPITVTVGPAQPLAIQSFTVTPAVIRLGQSATLSWVTTGASSVLIDHGVGMQPASGSVTVAPSADTTYTLTATFGSNTLPAQVTVTVLTTPIINVSRLPDPVLEIENTPGATTTFAVTNAGGKQANVTLSYGSIFLPYPVNFLLSPGQTQQIQVTAGPHPAGAYDESIGISVDGTPSGLQIPLRLLSTPAPSGPVTADPSASRVDVAATASMNPNGTVDFTNHGSAALTGVLSSDVKWIVPQAGVVTIAPGQTVTLTFAIDRTQRPDASALSGSAEGSLSLKFFSGGGSSFAAQRPLDGGSPIPSVSLVKVVDTVQTPVSVGGVPALAPEEVALFIPGVTHGAGNKGLPFASDLSIQNPQPSASVDDITLYYTALSGTPASAKSTPLPSVGSQLSIAVADVVKNIFSGSNEVGSLQIRSKNAAKLAVFASAATTSNPAGTFGNAVPVFRSDRAVAVNDAVVLTGVRKDNGTHTDVFVQEAAGSAATVHIDYLANDGSTVASADGALDAFKMLRLLDAVPQNAVAAIITNTSTAGGKIVAYATGTDEASGDTWTITDWSKQLGYAATDPAIIPIAGSVHGANNTFYRTDVAITNRGTSSASGSLRYVSRAGDKIDRQVSLGAKQTSVMTDVLNTTFNVSGDTTGYLIFTPATGSLAVSSRVYTTVSGKPDIFATSVPVVDVASALPVGGTRTFAPLNDAMRTTVITRRPSTSRTNFGLMETTGNPVTVRVTLRFNYPAGAKAQGIGAASRDYALSGNAFLLLNSIAGEIIGPDRLQLGDLTNIEADFQVISGKGAIVLFTSSVDNATGDSLLRTE